MPLSVPSPVNPNPEHSLWDAFEHILLFISLGVLAIALALTLHVFVDQWIPPGFSSSVYNYYPISESTKTLVRGYIAALLVSYPLFSFFFLNIRKRSLTNPQIQSLRSRKLLIYITLIITFLILIINIISITYNFLNGNVTLNFVMHFLVSIGISSIIFGYYLYQVKNDRRIHV